MISIALREKWRDCSRDLYPAIFETPIPQKQKFTLVMRGVVSHFPHFSDLDLLAEENEEAIKQRIDFFKRVNLTPITKVAICFEKTLPIQMPQSPFAHVPK